MFFERHRGGERAVLVQLQLEGAERDLSLIEFEELVVSAGGNPVAALSGSRRVPHARTFVGEGKLEEIAAKCREHEAELVIFNHALSPSQERNLEQVLACRVLALGLGNDETLWMPLGRRGPENGVADLIRKLSKSDDDFDHLWTRPQIAQYSQRSTNA